MGWVEVEWCVCLQEGWSQVGWGELEWCVWLQEGWSQVGWVEVEWCMYLIQRWKKLDRRGWSVASGTEWDVMGWGGVGCHNWGGSTQRRAALDYDDFGEIGVAQRGKCDCPGEQL